MLWTYEVPFDYPVVTFSRTITPSQPIYVDTDGDHRLLSSVVTSLRLDRCLPWSLRHDGHSPQWWHPPKIHSPPGPGNRLRAVGCQAYVLTTTLSHAPTTGEWVFPVYKPWNCWKELLIWLPNFGFNRSSVSSGNNDTNQTAQKTNYAIWRMLTYLPKFFLIHRKIEIQTVWIIL